MGKTILKIDDEVYDFILIGIVSTFRDFRICRDINSALELDLQRANDYTITDAKRNAEIGFSFFEYFTEQEDQYFVITNKGEEGLLIPERKQLDYFLLIKPGMTPIDASDIIKKLQTVSGFQGIFPIDVRTLKSKGNLLF
ncbi:MAG: hypothetical protein RIQ47_1928 [Bacteroidota bacterium]|jgi:hypothetical protein